MSVIAQTIPDIGIHEGISNETYHGDWNACSSTRLKWISRSPAYCYWCMTHPDRPTPAKLLGTACHHAILEPEEFETAYAVSGQCEGIKKNSDRCVHMGSYLRGGSWWCGVHKPDTVPDDSGIVLVRDDYDKARKMRDAVWGNAAASAILKRTTRRETSVVWNAHAATVTRGRADTLTYVRCKCRPDVLADDMLCDVKTTRDLRGVHDVDRWMANGGIHTQQAFYRRGLRAVGRPVKHCCLIVVHSEPPHEVAVFMLDADALRCGDERVRRGLEKYAKCQATGRWPGWASGVLPASVPAWELRTCYPEEWNG